MARTPIDTWDPNFLEKSSIFDSIREVSLPFVTLKHWPTLEHFSTEFKKRNIRSHHNVQVLPVGQGSIPEKFEDHYESRIYLKGELQTRIESWHDYFNAMCWLQFPKTKASLNALHFEKSKTRKAGANRGPLENAITLFDECGAVIVVDSDSVLDLIKNHEWKELFWNNKTLFDERIQCYVFGHALHEKSLTPYIGMTAHTIIVKQPIDFFTMDYSEQLKKIDQIISGFWTNKNIENTKNLQPFPLLGIPGWWNKNQDESFYLNDEYFRRKREGK